MHLASAQANNGRLLGPACANRACNVSALDVLEIHMCCLGACLYFHEFSRTADLCTAQWLLLVRARQAPKGHARVSALRALIFMCAASRAISSVTLLRKRALPAAVPGW